MNVRMTAFKGVAAALVLIAGGFGCSHSDGDQRLSRSERRDRARSERLTSEQNRHQATQTRSSASVAAAPPLTYANQPTAAQPTLYSTNVPVGMAAHQDGVVMATATQSPSTYSTPGDVAQNHANATNGHTNGHNVAPGNTYASNGTDTQNDFGARQGGTYPTDRSIAAGIRQSAAVTVTAPDAPPATPAEVPTHSTQKDEFWINGHWRWDSRSFSWQPGRVERLRSNELYHPATWVQSAQGWDFTPAYWQ